MVSQSQPKHNERCAEIQSAREQEERGGHLYLYVAKGDYWSRYSRYQLDVHEGK